jgi:signal transduction histidine kinase
VPGLQRVPRGATQSEDPRVELQPSVPITVVDELPSARFDDSVEATAYYVFAEALTNAQKHARASSLRVRLTATTDALRPEILDDGIGGAREPPAVA